MLESCIKFLLILTVIFLYYYLIVDRFDLISRPLAGILGLGRRYSSRDIRALVNLPLAGIGQAVFCFVLVLITGVDLGSFTLSKFQPILLFYGVLLGIGNMALSIFLCFLALHTARRLTVADAPTELKDWLIMGNAGWMQYYQRTLEIAPFPIAALNSLLYISIEEIIFRGVLINYFLPVGTAYALGVSVFFYVLVQIFHMPTWHAAMFPVIGAIVIGFVHGILFIAVPSIFPLIIAHFVFFMVAAL